MGLYLAIYWLITNSISIFCSLAGVVDMLYGMHPWLCSDSLLGLLNVWTTGSITSDFEPSKRQIQLTSCNIHNLSQSHCQICTDAYTNCECCEKHASMLSKQKAHSLASQYLLADQHCNCSCGHSFVWIPHVTCWSIAKCLSFDSGAVRLLLEDLRSLPEIWIRNDHQLCNSDNGCRNCSCRHLHISSRYN